MKTFSCLTVSKRDGWAHVGARSVSNQIVKPKHWVLVCEPSAMVTVFQKKSKKSIEVDVIKAPEKLRFSNLNASLNVGLKKINTDYVIFYQDFIELQEDCFEKLLALVDEKTFVTTCTPNYDGSDDSRFTGLGKPRACRPEEWEANVAIAPMKVIRELGGFDEEYDGGWSWDNVNLAERAAMLGCKFIIDESNRPKLLPHEQTSKLDMPLNLERHNRTMEAIRAGHKPLRLNYL